jgi:hypothetical protein
MYHPLAHEFLSKAKESDRPRKRQACQLCVSFRASRPARPSRMRNGMDLLRMLLMHAGKRLRETKTALHTLMWERASS